jgi:ParB family transcriptional regulator, chromosome partitioning protein
MTVAEPAQKIEWLPIDRVVVVNPRERNRKVFREIVENIRKIGLKRPITVTRRMEDDNEWFDLVCGQGRLEAYQMLGQENVPALVVSAEPDDCLIASLVENCARRQHNAIDLLQDIGAMSDRGHSIAEIARKTGLSSEYVNGVTRLLSKGEQRLLRSVESRTIPLSVAVEIAEADDEGIQRALHDAYDSGLLKGKRLLAARRLVEVRKRRGKALDNAPRTSPRMTTAKLIETYEQDVARKRELIDRSRATHNQLLLITEGLRRLSLDERFVALVEDEDLATLPSVLSDRINAYQSH